MVGKHLTAFVDASLVGKAKLSGNVMVLPLKKFNNLKVSISLCRFCQAKSGKRSTKRLLDIQSLAFYKKLVFLFTLGT